MKNRTDKTEPPLYVALYQDLKEKILNKAYPPSGRLPSIRAQAAALGVSLNTVKAAYAQLELEGYVTSVEKVGYFVEEIEPLSLQKAAPADGGAARDPDTKYRYDFSYSGADAALFPSSVWKKMFRLALEEGSDLLSQGDFKGYPALRNAIARYLYSSRGIQTVPSQIIISAGTEHLFAIVKRLLDPNTLFAFENPGYAFASPYFTYDLKNPVALSLDAHGVVIDPIRNLSSVALLVTPAHQFPTGVVMSISRISELLNWAGLKEERYIIEDDYDGEFRFREKASPSMKSMDTHDRVIYMGSFSRLITPALRVSYMVLPKKLMELFERSFKGFSCPVSLFVQKALSCFMSCGHFEKHLNRSRTLYARKYLAMKRAIEASKNIALESTSSGMVLRCRFPEGSHDAVQARLREASIRLYSLSDFYLEKSGDPNHYLLGFSRIPEEQIASGISLLDALLEHTKEQGNSGGAEK